MSRNIRNNFSLTLRELEREEDWQSLYPLIRQLNRNMSQKQFNTLLTDMRSRGYRCAGAYLKETMVGAAGFWIGWRFWCNKYIDIDNVVTDRKYRNKGIGKQLIAWIEKQGRKEKCVIAVLDSYTTAHDAHRFYFREGYSILGYHFTKDL